MVTSLVLHRMKTTGRIEKIEGMKGMNKKSDGCVVKRSGYNGYMMMREVSTYDRRRENGLF